MKWEKTSKKQDFLENIFVKAMCHDLRRKLTMHNYSMHNNQQIIKEFIVKCTNKIILMRKFYFKLDSNKSYNNKRYNKSMED